MRPNKPPRREKIYMYGKHALTEALLHAPHVIKKVFLSPEIRGSERELFDLLVKSGIPIEIMKHRDADQMVGSDAAHQGVIAVSEPNALLIDFKAFIKTLQPTERTMLVLLDELTDPHNVGAIIRSAAAFGAAGVLIPSHNQAPITGSVVKASAGMAFRVPLVSIGNINYTVDVLKQEGFRTYGLTMKGGHVLSEEKFDTPALFIVGNEAKGIRLKTFERCDVSLQIPMDPRCESLNASVSAALVMYQWSSQNLKS